MGWPTEDLQVIRTFPSVSSWDSIDHPKYSSTCTRCLSTLRQCSKWSSTSSFVARYEGSWPRVHLMFPAGEKAMWLVQSDVVVRVDPHAAGALPAVDEDDLLITG